MRGMLFWFYFDSDCGEQCQTHHVRTISAVGDLTFPRCVWTQHDAACSCSLHYLATGVAADGTEGIPGIFYTEAS